MVVPPRPVESPSGDDWLLCSDAPIDPGVASAWVVLPATGASVTFTGTTRDHAPGVTGVHLLEYEAYDEMVVPALHRVAAEVRRRHPDVGRVALWHRTGALKVTEVAVVVAVSAPHREAAFEAARWAIDAVKASAPIWKLEHHDGGTTWGQCHHEPAAAEVVAR